MLAHHATDHPSASQSPLTIEEVAPYLVHRGVLPMDALTPGRVDVQDASRRNRRFTVAVLGGKSLLVKQAARADDERGHRTLLQEADVLRALSLPGHVPAVLTEDRERGVLVTELVHPAVTLAAGGLPGVEAASDAGRLLRRVHEAGARAWRHGLALPDAPPPAWSLQRSPADTAAPAGTAHRVRRDDPEDASPTERAFLASLPDAYDVFAAQAMASWRANAAFVHGDVRWENILVVPDEGDGGPRLRLVGWESAGLGDPAWDVACYLGEHARAGLAAGRPDLADARAPARAFLDAYDGGPDVERRAGNLLPLHLVLVAHEFATHELPDASRAAVELAFSGGAKDAVGL